MKHTLRQLSIIFTKPEIVFLILATIFGVPSAILVPQLSVSDENMHFLKAYNLASGNLKTRNCIYPKDIGFKTFSIYQGNYSANYRDRINTNDLISVNEYKDPITGNCGSAASASPIMHLPQAFGILMAKLIYPSTGLMVLLGRLMNLAFFIVAIYFVIKKSRIGKWGLAVICLLPSSIHIAASLSYDVVNNVIVLAFAMFLFNLFTQINIISKKQIIGLLCLSCLLALTKLTNIFLLLPLVFLPVKLFEKNSIKKVPFNIKKWSLGLLCAIFVAICIIGWQKISGSHITNDMTGNPILQNPLHFLQILSATYINPFIGYNDIIVRGIVGEFASFRYHLPTFMVIFCFLILIITLLHRDKFEEKAMRNVSLPLIIGSLGALILIITGITYAMYTAWAVLPFVLGPNATYANGVQGRYFISILILLVPLFIWLRRFISFETKSKKTLGIIIFSSAFIWLLFYTIETLRFFWR